MLWKNPIHNEMFSASYISLTLNYKNYFIFNLSIIILVCLIEKYPQDRNYSEKELKPFLLF